MPDFQRLRPVLRRLGPFLPVFVMPAMFAAARPAPDDTLVRIDSGPILGEVLQGNPPVRVYRGIPYAAPPTGARRWRPPAPVSPWTSPRDCTRFGPVCPQPQQHLLSRIFREDVARQSEDCLYLNVWTAARRGEKRPVMVWIHGGGFVIGAGSLRTYDGTNLARAGVVLVTINYRLGPLGFLAHPALSAESPRRVSGNYGLLDQIAALRWVHRNIAAFGGDPGNVTIFGESAGAVSVGCLLVSPMAKGLFHRAVMESGTAFHLHTGLRDGFLSAEAQGEAIARAAGAESAEDLRRLTPEELLRAAKPRVGLLGKGRPMGPVIDGWVIPDAPARLMAAGKFHHVPVIIGTNADEGTLFVSQAPRIGPVGYRWTVRLLFPDAADELLDLFPPPEEGETRRALLPLVTLAAFAAPARLTARFIARTGAPAFLYHFTRVAPRLKSLGLGATHGIEIPYVFGTFGPAFGADDTDRRLSRAMMTYWTGFARTGTPRGDSLPVWPRYDRSEDRCLELGDEIRIRTGLHREACDLLDPVLCRWRGVPVP